jgi:Zn-dependent protease
MAHFDAYGLLALLLVRFGWGKPVPVNPNNFRNRKAGCILVSLSGVVANFLLAFIVYPLLVALILYVNIPNLGYFDDVLLLTLRYIPSLSLAFFAFNILPIYPLDGFKLYETLSGGRGSVYRFLRNYGSYILLGLILLGFVADRTGLWYLDILGTYVRWMSGILSYPITAFWGLIF